MPTPAAFTEFLVTRGRPLAEINEGSDEVALTPRDALTAVAKLSGSDTAILGGDVLSDASGRLAYTYENWYCNRTPGDNAIEYVLRSHAIARDFISKLADKADPHTYVVLVYAERR